MRYSFLIIFVFVLSLTSCRKDFDTVPSRGQLQFSKTTVYLDTVFTDVSSSTYMLKVYNRSNDDISIPTISLAKGNASKYRIMVDGMTGLDSDNNGIGDGKIFQNVELLAKDSLFVFIETTVDIASANPANMLYTDEIVFGSAFGEQKVNLVTLIQDAVFLFPEKYPDGTYEYILLGGEKVYGFPLDDTELNFTAEKPYVIYGYAAVPPGKILNIQAGARVHFHDQSGIIVGGSINVNGTPPPSTDLESLENEVIFEGDRLEPRFADTPGQWGTILLAEGSTNNTFNHATIKNSSVGLFIQNNDGTTVQIENTQIYNSANVGILARTGKINGKNIVINNAGQSSLACTLGGSYDFTHCTFANYWSEGTRQEPIVLLDNSINNLDIPTPLDLSANFTSCIIYGPNNLEIGLNKKNGVALTVNLNYCLIKFNDTNNQFSTNPLYTTAFLNNSNNNLIATNQNPYNPKFKNTDKNQLNILTGSSVIGKGKDFIIPSQDILGIDRTNPTDMGAYKFVP